MAHLKVDIGLYETNNKEILKDIRFILNENDRIALVGPNGVGKTTLFKLLSGQISEYRGGIENSGKLTIGYLSQIFFDDERKTVRDELRSAFTRLLEMECKIEALESQMSQSDSDEAAIGAYADLIEKFRLHGGYEMEYEIHRVSNGLGIVELLENRISEVSGGQRTKIALAKILLEKPDFLLLDEPTNFIDLASTQWLEKYLANQWKSGYIIISHDRDFLDKTCRITFELTGPRPIEIYSGNYSYYVKEKRKLEESRLDDWERQQEYIMSQTKLINRFRAGSRAGWAKSREKMIDRMELLEKPLIPRKPKFQFGFDEPSNNRILLLKDLFIGRREPLFYIRELELTIGQRVGIIGENGVGKSTLVKTVLGQIPPLEGLLNRGKGLQISYFSQLHEEIDKSKTIAENFRNHGFDYTDEKLMGILANYLFERGDIDKKAGELSGGQLSKLLFAILGQKSSNFLIFDEPTNHLDYEFREALETALSKYKGTILFISHDRYFINKIATHLWIIQDGEMLLNYGNYDDYLLKKERGISYDASLFDEESQLNFALEEKLGENEAKRIRKKFSKKR